MGRATQAGLMASARPAPVTAQAPSFTCTSCGRCCKKLLVIVGEEAGYGQGITLGLLLVPGEQRLFPHTAPMWRSGDEVLAYQVDQEPCPHWVGLRCRIYKRRPLACRAYPVWWGIVWRADSNCPQVAALGQEGEYRDQILAAHGMLRFLRGLYAAHQELEYYDLEERRWKHA